MADSLEKGHSNRKGELSELIDPQKDSLRVYTLGNQYQTKVQHVGAHPAYQPDDVLMV